VLRVAWVLRVPEGPLGPGFRQIPQALTRTRRT